MKKSDQKKQDEKKEKYNMRTYKLFITALLMMVVSFMTGCGTQSAGNYHENIMPSVSSTIPANAAVSVALNGNINATFSDTMDASSITAATFTLKQGTTPVACSVTHVGNVSTLHPLSNLVANSVYTATITTGVRSLAGNTLAVNKTWSFTTGTAADNTAPYVSSMIPANTATGVALNGNINATFDEGMDPSTITTTTFTLMQGANLVACSVSYAGFVATMHPLSNLAANTTYTATITTGVKDLAGNAKTANRVWTFTTGSSADTTAPIVDSTTPANSATGVAVNTIINATFSEGMDPLTLTTTTFTLKQGTTPVDCSVTYVGTIATLHPVSNLSANTIYTATITTGVKDLAGNAKASNKVWSFTTAANLDITAPLVSSTAPANAATGVAINTNLNATFSEAMNPLTLTTTTFTLKQGTTPVDCSVTYVGMIATLHPISNLAANTTYTALITTGAKDLAGNGLAVNKTWSFTTAATLDTTPPVVNSTSPANAATSVAINANVNATFSEAMNPLTLTSTTFTLKQGTTVIDCAVAYVGNVGTLTPVSNLAANTTYTALITTGAKDLAGNALAVNKTWSFTTAATLDTTPPVVNSTIPANAATGVALNTNVNATFSEAMNPATLTSTTFTLRQGVTLIAGTVSYVGSVGTLTPASNLAANTTYTATITTGAKDVAGNALAVSKTWSFTTAPTATVALLPVNLGTASGFVLLSKAGISSTGTTAITGKVGVSPIDSTAITGFGLIMDSSNTFSTSSLVTGRIYAADYTPPTPADMTTAISDMETAYTNAAGRVSPTATELGAGDISGLTIAPGLYKWGTGVLMSTDVVLNGGPNDVWIFQISGDITMAPGARITLTGGAVASNVFWQSYGAVILDTTSHIEGTVLCLTEISLATGATVKGRLLSQTAITLDANNVILP
ncbi:MAG: Ig-like domain-containing protein [Candidatus Margulisiibacteriota bacterium]